MRKKLSAVLMFIILIFIGIAGCTDPMKNIKIDVTSSALVNGELVFSRSLDDSKNEFEVAVAVSKVPKQIKLDIGFFSTDASVFSVKSNSSTVNNAATAILKAEGAGSAELIMRAENQIKKIKVIISEPVRDISFNASYNDAILVNTPFKINPNALVYNSKTQGAISPSSENKGVFYSLENYQNAATINSTTGEILVTSRVAGELVVRATSIFNSDIYAKKSFLVYEEININKLSVNAVLNGSTINNPDSITLVKNDEEKNSVTINSTYSDSNVIIDYVVSDEKLVVNSNSIPGVLELTSGSNAGTYTVDVIVYIKGFASTRKILKTITLNVIATPKTLEITSDGSIYTDGQTVSIYNTYKSGKLGTPFDVTILPIEARKNRFIRYNFLSAFKNDLVIYDQNGNQITNYLSDGTNEMFDLPVGQRFYVKLNENITLERVGELFEIVAGEKVSRITFGMVAIEKDGDVVSATHERTRTFLRFKPVIGVKSFNFSPVSGLTNYGSEYKAIVGSTVVIKYNINPTDYDQSDLEFILKDLTDSLNGVLEIVSVDKTTNTITLSVKKIGRASITTNFTNIDNKELIINGYVIPDNLSLNIEDPYSNSAIANYIEIDGSISELAIAGYASITLKLNFTPNNALIDYIGATYDTTNFALQFNKQTNSFTLSSLSYNASAEFFISFEDFEGNVYNFRFTVFTFKQIDPSSLVIQKNVEGSFIDVSTGVDTIYSKMELGYDEYNLAHGEYRLFYGDNTGIDPNTDIKFTYSSISLIDATNIEGKGNLASFNVVGLTTGKYQLSLTFTITQYKKVYSKNIIITIDRRILVERVYVSNMNSENYYSNATGFEKQLNVGVYPLSASNKNVKYITSNDRVVEISESGLMTIVGAGTVTVYVVSADSQSVENDFGDGTVYTRFNVTNSDGLSDPIRISTEEELQAIANAPDLNYLLVNDITLTKDFTPIKDFSGALNGNNFTIYGLVINGKADSNNYNFGLFANILAAGGHAEYFEGAVVENLNVVVSKIQVDVVDDSLNNNYSLLNIGTIAGENRGKISNVSVTKSNSAGDFAIDVNTHNVLASVGGIVGKNAGYLRGFNVKIDINATNNGRESSVGGAVGENSELGDVDGSSEDDRKTYSEVYVKINATNDFVVGAVAGLVSGTHIKNVYSMGIEDSALNGNTVGGVVGKAINATISDVVGKISVNANTYAGGVVGYAQNSNIINTKFVAAKTSFITGKYAGGIAGGIVASNVSYSLVESVAPDAGNYTINNNGISLTDAAAAGIAGFANSQSTISKSMVYAYVSGSGIVGNVESQKIDSEVGQPDEYYKLLISDISVGGVYTEAVIASTSNAEVSLTNMYSTATFTGANVYLINNTTSTVNLAGDILIYNFTGVDAGVTNITNLDEFNKKTNYPSFTFSDEFDADGNLTKVQTWSIIDGVAAPKIVYNGIALEVKQPSSIRVFARDENNINSGVADGPILARNIPMTRTKEEIANGDPIKNFTDRLLIFYSSTNNTISKSEFENYFDISFSDIYGNIIYASSYNLSSSDSNIASISETNTITVLNSGEVMLTISNDMVPSLSTTVKVFFTKLPGQLVFTDAENNQVDATGLRVRKNKETYFKPNFIDNKGLILEQDNVEIIVNSVAGNYNKDTGIFTSGTAGNYTFETYYNFVISFAGEDPIVISGLDNDGHIRVNYNSSMIVTVYEGATNISLNISKVDMTADDTIEIETKLSTDIDPLVVDGIATAREGVSFKIYKDGDSSNKNYLNNAFSILKSNEEYSGGILTTTAKLLVNEKFKNVDLNGSYKLYAFNNLNNDLIVMKTFNIVAANVNNIEIYNYASAEISFSEDGSIIFNDKELPSTEINPGKTGLIKVYLYPYFAEFSKIEITSNGSLQQNSKVIFNQYLLNENGKYVFEQGNQEGNSLTLKALSTVANNGATKSFDGWIYISTGLSASAPVNAKINISLNAYKTDADSGLEYISKTKTVTYTIAPSLELVVRKTGTQNVNKSFIPVSTTFELDVFVTKDYSADISYITTNGAKFIKKTGDVWTFTIENNNGTNIGTEAVISFTAIMVVNGVTKTLKADFVARVTLYTVEEIYFVENFNNVNGTTETVLDKTYNVAWLTTKTIGLRARYKYASTLPAQDRAKILESKALLEKELNEIKNGLSPHITYNPHVSGDFSEILKTETEYNNIITSTQTFDIGSGAASDLLISSAINITPISIGQTFGLSGNLRLMHQNGQFVLNTDSSIGGIDDIINFSANVEYDVFQTSNEDNPLPITTAEEFAKIFKFAGQDSTEKQHYILTEDITITQWPIVSNEITNFNFSTNFYSFDGNNKKIIITSNAYADMLSKYDATNLDIGLFGTVEKNTIIKNVTVALNGYYTPAGLNSGIDFDFSKTSGSPIINIGVLAGVNNGIITNCQVIEILPNTNTVVGNAPIVVKAALKVIPKITSSVATVYAGGLVGRNGSTGFITNSRSEVSVIVGKLKAGAEDGNASTDEEAASLIEVGGSFNVGGFVGVNENKISTSYVKNSNIHNYSGKSSDSSLGGFVAENKGTISYSYVESYFVRDMANDSVEIVGNLTDKAFRAVENNIKAIGPIAGGFVSSNSGNITDSYSNIAVISSKAAAGFVNENTTYGNITMSLTYSDVQQAGQQVGNKSRPFISSVENKPDLLRNYGTITNSYYLDYEVKTGDETTSIFTGIESASKISSAAFLKAESYNGFAFDANINADERNSDSIWEFSTTNIKTINAKDDTVYLVKPNLVSANTIAISDRKLAIKEVSEDGSVVYYYMDTGKGAALGEKNNPILISTASEFNEIANVQGKNEKYYRMISDISFDEAVTAVATTNTVFTAVFDGNGMTIDNAAIQGELTPDKSSDAIGLFSKLDGATIKALNVTISSLDASQIPYVGGLAGFAINSNVFAVNTSGIGNPITVAQGQNIVGGVIGKVTGNSRMFNISSNLGVKATYDISPNRNNIFGNEMYFDSTINTSIVYKNLFDNLGQNVEYTRPWLNTDQSNTMYDQQLAHDRKLSYAGGIIGIADVKNYTTKVDLNSLYVGNGARISGSGFVGGVIGLVSSSTKAADLKYTVASTKKEKFAGSGIIGGIIGENRGEINFAIIEHDAVTQSKLDLMTPKNEDNNFAKTELSYNELFSQDKRFANGAIIGFNNRGNLSNSYSKIVVNNKNAVIAGGITAINLGGIYEYVYATGSVIAGSSSSSEISYAGGIIGENSVVPQPQNIYDGNLPAAQPSVYLNSIHALNAYISDVYIALKNSSNFSLGGFIGNNLAGGSYVNSSNSVSSVTGKNISNTYINYVFEKANMLGQKINIHAEGNISANESYFNSASGTELKFGYATPLSFTFLNSTNDIDIDQTQKMDDELTAVPSAFKLLLGKYTSTSALSERSKLFRSGIFKDFYDTKNINWSAKSDTQRYPTIVSYKYTVREGLIILNETDLLQMNNSNQTFIIKASFTVSKSFNTVTNFTGTLMSEDATKFEIVNYSGKPLFDHVKNATFKNFKLVQRNAKVADGTKLYAALAQEAEGTTFEDVEIDFLPENNTAVSGNYPSTLTHVGGLYASYPKKSDGTFVDVDPDTNTGNSNIIRNCYVQFNFNNRGSNIVLAGGEAINVGGLAGDAGRVSELSNTTVSSIINFRISSTDASTPIYIGGMAGNIQMTNTTETDITPLKETVISDDSSTKIVERNLVETHIADINKVGINVQGGQGGDVGGVFGRITNLNNFAKVNIKNQTTTYNVHSGLDNSITPAGATTVGGIVGNGGVGINLVNCSVDSNWYDFSQGNTTVESTLIPTISNDSNSSNSLYYLGGLAGICLGNIINCYNNGNIVAGGNETLDGANFAPRLVGGLVGYFNADLILNSYNSAQIITRAGYVGGLVGQVSSIFTIKNCFVLRGVESTTGNAGGMIALYEKQVSSDYVTCYIKDSYVAGSVKGYSSASAFIARTSVNPNVQNTETHISFVGSYTNATINVTDPNGNKGILTAYRGAGIYIDYSYSVLYADELILNVSLRGNDSYIDKNMAIPVSDMISSLSNYRNFAKTWSLKVNESFAYIDGAKLTTVTEKVNNINYRIDPTDEIRAAFVRSQETLKPETLYPITVKNQTDLQNIGKDADSMSKFYVQTNDIAVDDTFVTIGRHVRKNGNSIEYATYTDPTNTTIKIPVVDDNNFDWNFTTNTGAYNTSKDNLAFFTGVYVGNNKKITGLKTSLFSYMNGTMSSLIIEDLEITNKYVFSPGTSSEKSVYAQFPLNTYGIARNYPYMYNSLLRHADGATIKNITFNNIKILLNLNVDGVKFSYASALVGYAGNGNTLLKSTISNIKVEFGTIQNVSSQIALTAGIVANSTAGIDISNSYNKAKLYAVVKSTSTPYTATLGGILGNSNINEVIITNCYNAGDMYGENTYNNSSAQSYLGGIVANINSSWGGTGTTITDCYNSGNISAYGGLRKIGGIIGSSISISIKNSFNIGNITMARFKNAPNFTDDTYQLNTTCNILGKLGGIAGEILNKYYLYNCYNKGELFGYGQIGGIAGLAKSTNSADNGNVYYCYNEGKISTADLRTNNVGGIIGVTEDATTTAIIRFSYNTAELNNYHENVGGIVGMADSLILVENCYNSGKLIAERNDAGGIVGQANFDAVLNQCYNSGDIYAFFAAGMISGNLCSNTKSTTINNCYNIGTINAKKPTMANYSSSDSAVAGGLLGWNEGGAVTSHEIMISNSYNAGAIICDNNIKRGGLIASVFERSATVNSIIISNSYFDNSNFIGTAIGDSSSVVSTDEGKAISRAHIDMVDPVNGTQTTMFSNPTFSYVPNPDYITEYRMQAWTYSKLFTAGKTGSHLNYPLLNNVGIGCKQASLDGNGFIVNFNTAANSETLTQDTIKPYFGGQKLGNGANPINISTTEQLSNIGAGESGKTTDTKTFYEAKYYDQYGRFATFAKAETKFDASYMLVKDLDYNTETGKIAHKTIYGTFAGKIFGGNYVIDNFTLKNKTMEGANDSSVIKVGPSTFAGWFKNSSFASFIGVKFKNVYVNVNSYLAGTFVADVAYSTNFVNCEIDNLDMTTNLALRTGGFAAQVDMDTIYNIPTTFDRCAVTSLVGQSVINANFKNGNGEAGGLVAHAGNVDFFHCFNTANITQKSDANGKYQYAVAGGIISTSLHWTRLIGCYNSGNIIADNIAADRIESYAGGLIGLISYDRGSGTDAQKAAFWNTYHCQISNSYNIGAIIANWAGQIAASASYRPIIISNCFGYVIESIEDGNNNNIYLLYQDSLVSVPDCASSIFNNYNADVNMVANSTFMNNANTDIGVTTFTYSSTVNNMVPYFISDLMPDSYMHSLIEHRRTTFNSNSGTNDTELMGEKFVLDDVKKTAGKDAGKDAGLDINFKPKDDSSFGADGTGSGTSASDPFIIASETTLRNLQNQIDAGMKYFMQTADIRVSTTALKPLLNFEGYYDGNGHTIGDNVNFDRLLVSDSRGTYTVGGFIGTLKPTATAVSVTNLTIEIDESYEDLNLINDYNFGGIIARAQLSNSISTYIVKNCKVSGSLKLNSTNTGSINYNVAGLVGSFSGSGRLNISNCESALDLSLDINTTSNSSIYVSGISNNSGTFNTKVINSGNISITSKSTSTLHHYISGISYAGIVSYSINKGNISLDAEYYAANISVSGIAGSVQSLTNSYNTGSISVKLIHTGMNTSYPHRIGGVSSYSFGFLTDCYNTGDISVDAFVKSLDSLSVAGVSAYLDASSSKDNCYNTGNITVNNTYDADSYNTGSYRNVYIGGLFGESLGWEFNNCYNLGDIKYSLTYLGDYQFNFYNQIGGLIAHSKTNSINVTNCFNEGSIDVNLNLKYSYSYNSIAGLVGKTYIVSTLNCYNLGDINFIVRSRTTSSLFNYIGGITGFNNTYNITKDISNKSLYNTGNINLDLDDFISYNYVGGISGYDVKNYSSLTVNYSYCYNYGDITTRHRQEKTSEDYTSGIIGQVLIHNFNINNCANFGDVTTTSYSIIYTGGIIGLVNTSGNIKFYIMNTYNAGLISATSFNDVLSIGGLVGGGTKAVTTYENILNCYNVGDVVGSAPSSRIGGLYGQLYSNLNMINCYNSGDVYLLKGDTYCTMGGLIGQVAATTAIVTLENCFYHGFSQPSSLANTTTTMYRGAAIGHNNSVNNVNINNFVYCYFTGTNLIGSGRYTTSGGSTYFQKSDVSSISYAKFTSYVSNEQEKVGATKLTYVPLLLPITNTDSVFEGDPTTLGDVNSDFVKTQKLHQANKRSNQYFGNGTFTNPYTIACYEDLNYWPRYSRNTFAYYNLVSNIDFSGRYWVPIGDRFNGTNPSEQISFGGVFNGNGYTISNMTYQGYTYREDLGLFSCLGDNSGTNTTIVKNLNITDVNINVFSDTNISAAALFTRKNTGTASSKKVEVNNIYTSGNITAVSEANIDSGSLMAYAGYEAGFLTIKNCTNDIDIYSKSVTGNSYVGGFVGYSGAQYYTIVNSVNNGNITSIYSDRTPTNVEVDAGGLLGSSRNIQTISNSANTGDIYVEAPCIVYAGGLAGKAENYSIVDNYISQFYNTGNVTVNAIKNINDNIYAGGIFGHVGPTRSMYISDSYNSGEISGKGGINLGGLIGRSDKISNIIQITDSYNIGDVKQIGDYSESNTPDLGGIVGHLQTTSCINFTRVYNAGNISSNNFDPVSYTGRPGGIIGWIERDGTARNYTDVFYRNQTLGLSSPGVQGNIQAVGRNTANAFIAVNKDATAMKTINFATTLGSSFAYDANINNGYPYLNKLSYKKENSKAEEDAIPENAIIIDSVASYAALFNNEKNNDFTGQIIYLKNDINFDNFNINNKLIDNFNGTFMGNGYTIKNLKGEGFIYRLGTQGIIRDLNITNFSFTGLSGVSAVGGIAAYNSGIIKNCHASGDLITSLTNNIGAICGYNMGKIFNSDGSANNSGVEVSTVGTNANNGSIYFMDGDQYKRFYGTTLQTIAKGQLLGSGTASDPYLISDRAGLEKIKDKDKLNSYFELVSDIDLSGENWTSIKTSYNSLDGGPFQGNFDGNYFSIKNLTPSNNNSFYHSAFGHVNPGALFGWITNWSDDETKVITIKNLNLENVYAVSNSSSDKPYAGLIGILGSVTDTITNIDISNITVSGTIAPSRLYDYPTGSALVGSTNGNFNLNIQNCINYANCGSGGLVNTGTKFNNTNTTSYGNITIDNCINYGNAYGGGIISETASYVNSYYNSDYKANITNCINYGTIYSDDRKISGTKYNLAGGIAGIFGGNIENCKNYGQIINNDVSSFTGGIAGYLNGTAKNCINYADLNSDSNNDNIHNSANAKIGGLFGSLAGLNLDSIASITNCENYGKISTKGGTQVGGIFGIGSGDTIIVTACSNYGDINIDNDRFTIKVGGIGGSVSSNNKLIVDDCHNYANVTALALNSLSDNYISGIISSIKNSFYKPSYKINFINCSNSGMLTNSSSANGADLYAGGIVAEIGPSGQDYESINIPAVFEKCYNTGEISLANQFAFYNGGYYSDNVYMVAGGIIARYRCDIKLVKSYNIGDISTKGNSHVGGLIGDGQAREWAGGKYANYPQKLDIEFCYNLGNITIEGHNPSYTSENATNEICAGGFVGNIWGPVNVTDSYTYSDISVTPTPEQNNAVLLDSMFADSVTNPETKTNFVPKLNNVFYGGNVGIRLAVDGDYRQVSKTELLTSTFLNSLNSNKQYFVQNPDVQNGYPYLYEIEVVTPIDYKDRGSGTSSDPFKIYDAADVDTFMRAKVATNNYYYYKIMNNIDMSSVANF